MLMLNFVLRQTINIRYPLLEDREHHFCGGNNVLFHIAAVILRCILVLYKNTFYATNLDTLCVRGHLEEKFR